MQLHLQEEPRRGCQEENASTDDPSGERESSDLKPSRQTVNGFDAPAQFPNVEDEDIAMNTCGLEDVVEDRSEVYGGAVQSFSLLSGMTTIIAAGPTLRSSSQPIGEAADERVRENRQSLTQRVESQPVRRRRSYILNSSIDHPGQIEIIFVDRQYAERPNLGANLDYSL